MSFGGVFYGHAVGAAVAGNGPNVYIEFNGASSYIGCGSDASLDDIHAGVFTVDSWIRPRKHEDETSDLIIKGSAAGWGFSPNSDLTDYVVLKGYVRYSDGWAISEQDWSQAADTGALDEWHHVVMSYRTDDGTVWLAIDGAWVQYSEQTATSGTPVTDASYTLVIGRASWAPITPENFFEGDVSWLRISSGIRYPIGVNFTPPGMGDPPAVDGDTIELWAMDEGTGVVTMASVASPANDGAMTDCVWGGCVS